MSYKVGVYGGDRGGGGDDGTTADDVDESPRLFPPPAALDRSCGRGRGGSSSFFAPIDAANDAATQATIPSSAYFAPPPSTGSDARNVKVRAPEVVRVVEGVTASVRYSRGGVANIQFQQPHHQNLKNEIAHPGGTRTADGGTGGGLRFPAARHVLWDATPIGNEVHISSHQHAPTVRLTPELTRTLVREWKRSFGGKRGGATGRMPIKLKKSPSNDPTSEALRGESDIRLNPDVPRLSRGTTPPSLCFPPEERQKTNEPTRTRLTSIVL